MSEEKAISFRMCEIETQREFDNLPDLLQWSCIKEYAHIKHTKDVEPYISADHRHIMLKFNNPVPLTAICSHFGIEPQFVEKIKGKWNDAVAYLTHENTPEKAKYPRENVTANFDINRNIDKVLARKSVDDVIKSIDSGDIREYNVYEKVPIDVFSKYENRIKSALRHYIGRISMDVNRNIKVIAICGPSGCGKTTFAKRFCHQQGYSYCVSSSSNDPMQDYKGQDVLILDDLRDSDFKFTDLLKILDNNTRSSMSSRYYNKIFIGHTIIITSYKDIEDWYSDIDPSARVQFFRRISELYRFSGEFVECYHYSLDNANWVYDTRVKYVIDREDAVKVVHTMFDALGLEIDKSTVDDAMGSFVDANGKLIPFDFD